MIINTKAITFSSHLAMLFLGVGNALVGRRRPQYRTDLLSNWAADHHLECRFYDLGINLWRTGRSSAQSQYPGSGPGLFICCQQDKRERFHLGTGEGFYERIF